MSDKKPAPEKEKWNPAIINESGEVLLPAERVNQGRSYKEYINGKA